MVKKSLQDLADLTNGRVVGDEKTVITGINTIDQAKEHEITFFTSPKYLSMVSSTQASAIIVPPEFKKSHKPLLCTENPYLAYAKIADLFYTKPYQARGIDRTAIIGENAEIGKDVSIG